MDPYTNFGISKFKKPKTWSDVQSGSLSEHDILSHFLYKLLPQLSSRALTGNAAKAEVEDSFKKMNPRLAKWCERILLRKLRCGVQITTANKIWPGLIKPFETQAANVCESHVDDKEQIIIDELIQFPVQCEPKFDGLRTIAIKHNGQVTLFSRNGTEFETLERLKTYLQSREDIQEIVLDGEGLVDGNWNDSASVLMSFVNFKDDTKLVYNVFDIMSYDEWTNKKSTRTLKERREQLESSFTDKTCIVKIAPYKTCSSTQELISYYLTCLNDGFEGIMIKDLNGLYEFKRTDAWKKLKPEATYEGVIVATYDGNIGSKREGKFGGFYVLLPNGVTTKVGSGMSDLLKSEIEADREKYIGKICEVAGQPPLTVDGKIRFPRFKRFRDESDVDEQVLSAYFEWQQNNNTHVS